MDIEAGNHGHFKSFHLGPTSTFSSEFPVDDANPLVAGELFEIPQLVDSALAMRGANETFETTNNGHIPLTPAHTILAIERTEQNDLKRILHNRHFVFASLTDGAHLRTAQLQFDRVEHRVEELSLVCHGTSDKGEITIELRAVINNPHEDVFEVVTYYQNGEDDESFIIDADVASAFVHALRENQAGRELETLSMELGVLDLLEKSQDYVHTQYKRFDFMDENGSLSIHREQRLVDGLARTLSLVIELEEQTENDEMRAVRKFTLNHSDDPTAQFDCLIDSKNQMGSEGRAVMFEGMSVHLRANPSIPFTGMRKAIERLLQVLD